MRVRKFTPLRIPSKNVARAVRFYREVFDLPTEFGENESRHLYSINNQLFLKKSPTLIQLQFK
ncbi:MAG: hypothetical protein ACLUQY_07235 [Weissella confusa]